MKRDEKQETILERMRLKIDSTPTGKIGVHECNFLLLERISKQLAEPYFPGPAPPPLPVPEKRKKWWQK